MKCMICGRRTLPGAKLCLPCRAALRRARDDTVSELLPMPGRVGTFAAPGASAGSGALDRLTERRASRRLEEQSRRVKPEANAAPYSPLRVAAVALFVLAMGFLAYGFGQQLRSDAQPLASHEPMFRSSVPAPTSVSPTSLAAEARNNVLAPGSPRVEEERAALPPAVVVPPKPARSAKTATRSAAKVEAAAITPVIVVPPAMVAAASVPAPAPAPIAAPDRWQLLSAALGRCNGPLLSKLACEQSARAEYCDGYWAQAVQCPAGVVNDHGQ